MAMWHKRIKYGVAPLLAVVVLLLAAKTDMLPFGRAQKPVAGPAVIGVTVAAAQTVTKTPRLNLTGSVEGETSALISAKINGRIEEIMVDDGQPVAAGQALLRLESLESSNTVRIGEEGLRKAQVNLENIEADCQRYRTLHQQSAVSRQTLDTWEARLRVAQAELETAQAGLSSNRQQLSYTVVAAPVNGVIANKTAVIGQVVAAGQTLMSVENIAQVYAVVNLEQKDLGVVRAGMPAEITVDAYPGKTFLGQVDILNPAALVANRMFKAKIRVDNSGALLKPGMFVKTGIVTGQPAPAVAVPQSAVFQKQGLYYVFLLEGDKAVRRAVEVGEPQDEWIEIISGVQPGMPVITANVNKLKDGDTVQVSR